MVSLCMGERGWIDQVGVTCTYHAWGRPARVSSSAAAAAVLGVLRSRCLTVLPAVHGHGLGADLKAGLAVVAGHEHQRLPLAGLALVRVDEVAGAEGVQRGVGVLAVVVAAACWGVLRSGARGTEGLAWTC